MPEYLAPGVYVEETSFRAKSIEGVSTTTTGFIGPSRYGPVDLEPDVVTSLGEFERTYGDRQQLNFSDTGVIDNYLWHAVRAFFEEGGKRLYISRVFRANGNDGCAITTLPSAGGANAVTVKARFPGAAGNMRVRFDLVVGQNVLGTDENDNARVAGLADQDVVWIGDTTSPVQSPVGSGKLYIASFDRDAQAWSFKAHSSPPGDLQLSQLHRDQGDVVRQVTVSVTAIPNDPNGFPETWAALPPEPTHQQAGTPDSLTAKFAAKPNNLALARSLPIVVSGGTNVKNGLDVLTALFNVDVHSFANPDTPRSVEVPLKNGNDGLRPSASEYEGTEEPKKGLKIFEDLDDISIVAAPGSTFGFDNSYSKDANTIVNLLISHAERMRYRIAVLDSGQGQEISQVRAMRARFDSKYAALYYPWVRVLDPVTRTEINLPP